MSGFEADFGNWVVRRRWWLIVATVLVVAAAASGARLLTFSNDLRVFFSDRNSQLQALEALENTYNKIDNVLIAVAPRDGDVFTAETLAAPHSTKTPSSYQRSSTGVSDYKISN